MMEPCHLLHKLQFSHNERKYNSLSSLLCITHAVGHTHSYISQKKGKQGYTLRSRVKFCKLYTVINTQELYKIRITNTSHLHARSTCSYWEITWCQ